MRKKSGILLVMLSLALLNNGLFAQPTEKTTPRADGMRALDLTEEQNAKIQDLQLELEKSTVALHSKLQAVEVELKQELIAEKFNQVKVKNLFEQKAKILVEMELARFINQRAIRDLLTFEQRKKFDLQILREHAGMRRHPFSPAPMRPRIAGKDPRHREAADVIF